MIALGLSGIGYPAMLEVLKHLQVKPPSPRAQVEICNQKSARDWHFLGQLHLRAFVLHAHEVLAGSPPEIVCRNAPALSRENAAST